MILVLEERYDEYSVPVECLVVPDDYDIDVGYDKFEAEFEASRDSTGMAHHHHNFKRWLIENFIGRLAEEDDGVIIYNT